MISAFKYLDLHKLPEKIWTEFHRRDTKAGQRPI